MTAGPSGDQYNNVMQLPLTGIGAVGASGAGVTLTIPAGTYATYLSYLQVVAYAAAATVGAAAPVTVTTTNAGGLAFTFPTALAIGTTAEQKYEGHAPLKGAPATAITIVCPATTGIIWRVNAGYFQSQ